MMEIKDFLTEFKDYCDRKFGTNTGTAVSYVNSIKYLLSYLDFSEFNDMTIISIKSIEPDLRNKLNTFYLEMLSYFKERGQSSYVKKGFITAAIRVLYDYWNTVNDDNSRLACSFYVPPVKDDDIKVLFEVEKLDGRLPIKQFINHDYVLRKTSGTTNDAVRKIRNGRAAEKYFISYLKDFIKAKENVEFFDVANNKKYGYDIRLHECGLEIKNIKGGAFYLTDNEIARLKSTETHLVLVDIGNGIWLLKNDSKWLSRAIENIKEIRNYCFGKYPNLDLSDIRIMLDVCVCEEIIDISKMSRMQLYNLLNLVDEQD